MECQDCHRQVSRHTLLHTHRCPAKKKREAAEAAAAAPVAEVAEPVAEAPAKAGVASAEARPTASAEGAAPRAKKAAKATPVKPAVPDAEVQKPLKQRAVTKKAEQAREYGYQPEPQQPQDLYSQLMMQRQIQSRMRAEAAASPYAQMFAQQRPRVM